MSAIGIRAPAPAGCISYPPSHTATATDPTAPLSSPLSAAAETRLPHRVATQMPTPQLLNHTDVDDTGPHPNRLSPLTDAVEGNEDITAAAAGANNVSNGNGGTRPTFVRNNGKGPHQPFSCLSFSSCCVGKGRNKSRQSGVASDEEEFSGREEEENKNEGQRNAGGSEGMNGLGRIRRFATSFLCCCRVSSDSVAASKVVKNSNKQCCGGGLSATSLAVLAVVATALVTALVTLCIVIPLALQGAEEMARVTSEVIVSTCRRSLQETLDVTNEAADLVQFLVRTSPTAYPLPPPADRPRPNATKAGAEFMFQRQYFQQQRQEGGIEAADESGRGKGEGISEATGEESDVGLIPWQQHQRHMEGSADGISLAGYDDDEDWYKKWVHLSLLFGRTRLSKAFALNTQLTVAFADGRWVACPPAAPTTGNVMMCTYTDRPSLGSGALPPPGESNDSSAPLLMREMRVFIYSERDGTLYFEQKNQSDPNGIFITEKTPSTVSWETRVGTGLFDKKWLTNMTFSAYPPRPVFTMLFSLVNSSYSPQQTPEKKKASAVAVGAFQLQFDQLKAILQPLKSTSTAFETRVLLLGTDNKVVATSEGDGFTVVRFQMCLTKRLTSQPRSAAGAAL